MATTNYTGKEKRSNHTLETDKSESLLHFKIAEMTIRIAFIVLFYLAVIVVFQKWEIRRITLYILFLGMKV